MGMKDSSPDPFKGVDCELDLGEDGHKPDLIDAKQTPTDQAALLNLPPLTSASLPPAPPLTELSDFQLRDYAIRCGEENIILNNDITRHVAEKASIQRSRAADKERIKELQEKVQQKSASIERRSKDNEKLEKKLEHITRNKDAMLAVNVSLETKIMELEAENAKLVEQHAAVLEQNVAIAETSSRMVRDHMIWETKFLQQAKELESWKEEAERLRSLVAVPSGPRSMTEQSPPLSRLDRKNSREEPDQHRSGHGNDGGIEMSRRETSYHGYRGHREERERPRERDRDKEVERDRDDRRRDWEGRRRRR